MEVEQETYMDLYANRIIRVLTINSLPGDLGTADGNFTDGVSGDVMRRVLENKSNFSPSGTIPILWVTEGTDVDARMTHGINPSLGVFYCGESKITSSRGNGMSAQAAASGTITSDLDILMANI